MPRTVVAFNAHPDDEALLTGGTLAWLASQGHRVVLVTATDGGAGPAAVEHQAAGLGTVRLGELQASARALGAARVVPLGYADSGLGTATADAARTDGPVPLTHADPAEVTDRLVAVLREERADVLLSCDAAGGYGHPDHIVVHQVARAAADRAGTARLLEATAPREPLLRALRAFGLVHRFAGGFRPQDWAQAFTPVAQITHRVDVRPWIRPKRAAIAAHVSQAGADEGGDIRTLALVLRLPVPVFALLLGREYFHDPALAASAARSWPVGRDDILAGP